MLHFMALFGRCGCHSLPALESMRQEKHPLTAVHINHTLAHWPHRLYRPHTVWERCSWRQCTDCQWTSRNSLFSLCKMCKACRPANKAIMESRSMLYRGCIQEADTDTWRRWSAIRDVLHLIAASEPTSTSDNNNLCHSFVNFFNNKIQTIKTGLISNSAEIKSDDRWCTSHITTAHHHLSTYRWRSAKIHRLHACSVVAYGQDTHQVIKLCPELFFPCRSPTATGLPIAVDILLKPHSSDS